MVETPELFVSGLFYESVWHTLLGSTAFHYGREHTQHVPVGEECHVAFDRAGSGYHPVRPRIDLLRSLAARASVPENQPARRRLMDLPGRQTLVCAIIPLDEVGFDNGRVAETRQFAGLAPKTFTFVPLRVRRCRPQSNARPRKPLPAPTSSR